MQALLEITVISAEGLTLSSRPIKKNAFAALSTDSHNRASTRLDAEGGSSPRWNEKLRLGLPPSARSLAVEVRCGAGPGARALGAASIPVSDFYGGILPADYLHLLSYRLRDPQGHRNGIINLSIRAHAPQQQLQLTPPPPLPPSWAPGGKVGGQVALGIPVRDMNI